MRISFISFILLSCITVISAQGQQSRFGAALFGGISMSQIRGDLLAGFHKVGPTAGIRGITRLNDRWNVNLELAFHQKGSRNGLFPDNAIPRAGLDLNYIEIPITVELKDWLEKANDGTSYSKVGVHAGLSYGRLISSSATEVFTPLLDLLRENDLSYVIGLRYRWNRHFAISGRYTRSLLPVAESLSMMQLDTLDLYPYSISLRLEYIL